MNSLRITGVYDNSGYGVANKATASLLIKSGLDITTGIINTPMSRQEFAQDTDFAEVVRHVSSRKVKVNLVQLIPSLWHYGFQKGTYNIGYFFWESNKICDNWIDIINNGPCDEVWVPCMSNFDALVNSGIKKPVYVVPQFTKFNIIDEDEGREVLPIPNERSYKFYSIFQWSQRKNPEALFKAYFNEFKDENVMLVVKTYGPSPFADRRWIKEAIINMKEKSGSKAPVFLFGELLTPAQINAIHPQCDCYVYTGRAEGWNIPLLESMAFGKQVITSKTGGIADWIKDEAYVVPHTTVPIDASTQAWGSFYQSDPPQQWGDVKIEDVQAAMRKAYIERRTYTPDYKNVLNVCSEKNVIAIIRERLKALNF